MTGGRVAEWMDRLRSRLEALSEAGAPDWEMVFGELKRIEGAVGLLEEVAQDSFGAFEQSVRDLSLLRSVHRLVTDSFDEERLCSGFLEILDREIPCRASALDLERGSRPRVVSGDWSGAADEALADAGGQCARDEGLLDLQSPNAHAELAPLAEAAGQASVLICPVETLGRLFAVLHRFDGEARHFRADEVRVTRAVCDLLGLALRHLALSEQQATCSPLPGSRRDSSLLSLARSEKLFALDRLAASVAHELNNPMSYVLSNFGRAREYLDSLGVALGATPDPPGGAPGSQEDVDVLVGDFRCLLDETEEGLDRMRTVAHRLHDVGGRSARPQRPVDLNEVVETALAMARGEAKPSIRFELALKPLPPVDARRFELVHAVFNLIMNAIEAVNSDGEVRLATSRAGPWARVEVIDDGPPVGKCDTERLFEPFYTAKSEPHEGLGLPIARAIARAHGGELDLEVGDGAVATLSLPVLEAESRD